MTQSAAKSWGVGFVVAKSLCMMQLRQRERANFRYLQVY